jgi:uncharacterized protein YjbI with pentapeptide repeats
MAYEEQLSILKKGVDVWNQWRKEHPNININLSRHSFAYPQFDGVDFNNASLFQADLNCGNLSNADLTNADLREANLELADLSGANLSRADLSDTQLTSAVLKGADLSGAYLINAILSEANLDGANFTGANLSGCDLKGASLNLANFQNATLKEAVLIGANMNDAKFRKADMRQTQLMDANLNRANLSAADLRGAELFHTNLDSAILRTVNLSEADLTNANLSSANLHDANLMQATLQNTNLYSANLSGAKLGGANLEKANMRKVNLSQANLEEANLRDVDLREADLSGADLRHANLIYANLTRANIQDAKISRSTIYGVNVWDLDGDSKEQKDLIITHEGHPIITVDNIKVAQFIHLILNNEEIRDVINTLTSKSVLILGRFADDKRKAILNALRNNLRKCNLLPIVFDFDRPIDRNITETVKTLAGISYFVIADVTSPKSSPLELQAIIPDYQIPVVPIIQKRELPFSMINDLKTQHIGLLDPLTYSSEEELIKVLKSAIIDPAIEKHNELRLIKAQKPKIRSAKDFLKKGKLS